MTIVLRKGNDLQILAIQKNSDEEPENKSEYKTTVSDYGCTIDGIQKINKNNFLVLENEQENIRLLTIDY